MFVKMNYLIHIQHTTQFNWCGIANYNQEKKYPRIYKIK